MIEIGENLPLVAEAFQQERASGAAADQLDGDRLDVEPIRPGGEIDLAHSSTTDFLLETVVAHILARARDIDVWHGRRLEKSALRSLMCVQQRMELRAQLGVLAA